MKLGLFLSGRCSILVALFWLLFFSCNRNITSGTVNQNEIYNQILDQIIRQDHLMQCLSDSVSDILLNKFQHGNFDSSDYSRIVDSLVAVDRSISKCVIDYREHFYNSAHGNRLNDDVLASLRNSISEGLNSEVLYHRHIKLAIQRLGTPASISAKSFDLGYVQVVPHLEIKYKPWGDGIGIVSFSEILDIEELNQSILYFEYIGGPKYGAGDLLFIAFKDGRWVISKRVNVWLR